VELLVGDIFRNAARAAPDRVAVADGPHRLTFGELDLLGNRLAHRLRNEGVGLGDRVVALAAASIEMAPVYAATAKLGAVFAPMNGRLTLDEAAPFVETARPRILVTEPAHAELAAQLATKFSLPWITADLVSAGTTAGPSVADTDIAPVPGLGERSPHIMFFTSGSTGRPKAVVLSHRTSVLRSHPGAMLEPRGALICPFPLFHMGAWTLSLQQWHARDALVLTAADGQSICDAAVEHRAARLYLIPAIWRRVLDHATRTGADLSSVRVADTGTSATPQELLVEMSQRFPGALIRVFYGSTEAGNVTSLDFGAEPDRPGSCGQPSPMTEIRVATGGELQVRSAIMFDGYFENQEATAAAFDDEWFRTGDRAEVDAAGFVRIVGRTSELIRTGGEAVEPAEVEAVLRTHPLVDDVAIVGVPDPQWGEIVCAAITTRGEPTLTDLREHCAAALATYKHPRRLLVVDEIPRTAATMQVQRRLLVELALGTG
jgi:fatty-acyl-CoA synthase